MDPKSILIVDDEVLIADQLAEFLGEKGYRVTHVGSGEKALRLLQEGTCPDLILMDIDLGRGRMDGVETTKQIYAHADVPVIFHSCHSDEATISKTRSVSKYGIIDKVPGNEIFLLATIEMAFTLHETNKKLKESEERYRTLAEAAHDMIFIVDRSECVTYANRFAFNHLKCDLNDIIGKPVRELFPPESYKHQHQNIQSVFTKGEPVYKESRIAFPGSDMWLGTWLIPLKDQKGQTHSAMGIARDISDRKRAEEAHSKSQQLLQRTFSSLRDAIFIIDEESSKILDFNPAASCMFGYAREELIGMTMSMLCTEPSSVGEFTKGQREKAAEKDFVFFPDIPMRRKNGSVFPVEFTVISLKDEHEKGVGWMCVVHEITEQKKAESALRESEERFRNLFDNSTIGIYRTTPDGYILFANHALIHMLGYASFDDLAKRNLEVNGFEPDYARSAFKKRIEKEGMVKGLETAWKRRDGSSIFIRESAKAIRGADGRVVYYEGTVEDVTDKKHAEEQMRNALAQKDMLLKELKHRMKNNMAVISSLLGLEMRKLKDPHAVHIITEARSRIKSMAQIYDTLSQSDNLERIDFRRYIQNLVQGLFQVYNIHPNTIQMNVQVEEVQIDLKKAVPCGLILNELISNALKYAFPDGKTGEIDIVLQKKGRDKIEISVKDDGVGFSEPFNKRSPKTMGLHIVTTMVQQIDGQMQYIDRKGTEFRISFPA